MLDYQSHVYVRCVELGKFSFQQNEQVSSKLKVPYDVKFTFLMFPKKNNVYSLSINSPEV